MLEKNPETKNHRKIVACEYREETAHEEGCYSVGTTLMGVGVRSEQAYSRLSCAQIVRISALPYILLTAKQMTLTEPTFIGIVPTQTDIWVPPSPGCLACAL